MEWVGEWRAEDWRGEGMRWGEWGRGGGASGWSKELGMRERAKEGRAK